MDMDYIIGGQVMKRPIDTTKMKNDGKHRIQSSKYIFANAFNIVGLNLTSNLPTISVLNPSVDS